jgi:hypothetical protein
MRALVPSPLRSLAALVPVTLPASAAEPMTFEWDLHVRHEHVQDDAFHPDTGTTTAPMA